MGRLRRADGALFRVVGGQTVLFSEARQSVLELNDTAAFIWCHLQDGVAAESLAGKLVENGLGEDEAADFVQTALAEWQRLGLVHNGSGNLAGDAGSPVALRRLIDLGGLAVEIRCGPERCADLLAPSLQGFPTGSGPAEIRLDIVAHDVRFRLLRNGRLLRSCSAEEVAPLLREALTTELLDHGVYAVALHAAALVHEGRILLVCGEPGAGKTTLALALVQAGFGFAGDDTALLDAAGRVAGVPFAPTVKKGGWRIAARYRPDLASAPTFRRRDGIRLRYLPVIRHTPGALPVGWIVVLRRQAEGAASLEPIEPVEALRELIAGAFTPDERLSRTGFDALARLLEGAQSYRLVCSSANDAAARLGEMCACPGR